MTPEEKARVKIDQMFEDAGWKVVDRDFYSPSITAAAIREGLLTGNHEADYFLCLNGKVVGVLEAKRAEVVSHPLLYVNRLLCMPVVYLVAIRHG